MMASASGPIAPLAAAPSCDLRERRAELQERFARLTAKTEALTGRLAHAKAELADIEPELLATRCQLVTHNDRPEEAEQHLPPPAETREDNPSLS